MAGIQINRITNANVYINGGSQLGRAKNFELPQIENAMQEFEAMGMVGKAEFFAGLEKMEAKIVWNSFYANVLGISANPTVVNQLQLRSSIDTYGSSGLQAQAPLVIHLSASFKSLPLGNFQQHENVELESMMSVYYVKVEIDGVSRLEIDILANIYKVDGVDILAQYRANLGI